MAAWGFTAAGRRVRMHLVAGSKEYAATVSSFFQDMRARGLGDPFQVVSDGAPGMIKAIGTRFPRSARRRCLAHRRRNLAAKLPEDVWPEVKARIWAAYQSPSRAIARDLATGGSRMTKRLSGRKLVPMPGRAAPAEPERELRLRAARLAQALRKAPVGFRLRARAEDRDR